MVLPAGLLSKHRSRMLIQRASLGICVLAQAVGCIADPSNGGYDVAVARRTHPANIFTSRSFSETSSAKTHFLFCVCI